VAGLDLEGCPESFPESRMFIDTVAPGDIVGPAQVALEYILPYESLTEYAMSAEVGLPALLTVKVTFVGELTW